MGTDSRVKNKDSTKLPDIGRGFHGFGGGFASAKAAQINVEDVDIEFEEYDR